eukprot:5250929-Karenia_brevis.AAC.1
MVMMMMMMMVIMMLALMMMMIIVSKIPRKKLQTTIEERYFQKMPTVFARFPGVGDGEPMVSIIRKTYGLKR